MGDFGARQRVHPLGRASEARMERASPVATGRGDVTPMCFILRI